MSWTRTKARRLAGAHDLTPRQVDRLRAEATIQLQGVPAGWRCESGGCLAAALYALRPALELGGTVVEIQRGAHRHRFDVVDLLRHRVRVAGLPSRPLPLPPNRGVLAQHALGNVFEEAKTVVPVPAAVGAENADAGLSGSKPGQEDSNGQ